MDECVLGQERRGYEVQIQGQDHRLEAPRITQGKRSATKGKVEVKNADETLQEARRRAGARGAKGKVSFASIKSRGLAPAGALA